MPLSGPVSAAGGFVEGRVVEGRFVEGPVADGAFAAAMTALGPFEAAPRLAVGVSGGADSVACALLADRWARGRGGSVIALICDHGLRDGSAAEADAVAARLRALGIEASVLTLGVARGTSAPARARAARFSALARACTGMGVAHLLLGHHATDQAETLMMRAVARSGADGLAGMAALRETARVLVLRPLLGFRPDSLRATCAAAGVAWVSDPTNHDPAYLRARLRVAAGLDGATEALTGAARVAGGVRAGAEAALAARLARVTVRPEGFAWTEAPLDAGVLAAVIGAIGGRAHRPPADACARLARAAGGGTLGGARVLRRGAKTVVVREAGPVAADAPARPGMLWDGRYRVAASVPGGMTIGALGASPARRGVPAAAMAALPAMRRAGAVVGDPLDLRWLTFAPARPMAPAGFVIA